MTTLFPVADLPLAPGRRRTPLITIDGNTWEKQIWHDLGAAFGWQSAHFRAVETKHRGYTVPVGAHGDGWPDFTMVRDRVIYVEAKAGTGRVQPKQADWLRRLEKAGQEVYVFRPEYLEEIAAVLRHRGRPDVDHPARAVLLELLAIDLTPPRTKGKAA